MNPQSLNRYAYALNNPTTLTDPLGLTSIPACGSGVICVSSWGSGGAPPEVDSPLAGLAVAFCSPAGGECGFTPGPFFGTWNGFSFSSHPANIISWPQLQKLVHANNKSNLCDTLIDCIIFRESHVGKGGVPSGLNASFNPNALGPLNNGQHAEGLMQIKPSTADLAVNNWNGFPAGAANDLFNAANNIQIGSAYLQFLSTRLSGVAQSFAFEKLCGLSPG